MGHIRLDKKTIIIISSIVLAAGVFYILMAPLFGKVRRVGSEVKALESEVGTARQAIQSAGKFQSAGKLLTRQKVSLAIDEITKTGATQNIIFLSISPQKIMKPKGSKYPALPIEMELQSDYRNLGTFFGALEKLEQSIVAVRSFEVDVDHDMLPQIKTDLVVEVYLEKGEDG